MITTLKQVKTLLGIADTDTTNDNQILEYLPIVQEWITDYTNNKFLVEHINQGGQLVFTAATDATTPAKITLTGAQFVTEGFGVNMDFYVTGSANNDGFYSIKALTETIIDLAGNPLIIPETTEYSAYVILVKWPKPLQSVAASIIGDRIQRPEDINSAEFTKSEKVGDYTITYDRKVSDKLKDWKDAYKSEIRPYMRPKFVKAKGRNLVNVRN